MKGVQLGIHNEKLLKVPGCVRLNVQQNGGFSVIFESGQLFYPIVIHSSTWDHASDVKKYVFNIVEFLWDPAVCQIRNTWYIVRPPLFIFSTCDCFVCYFQQKGEIIGFLPSLLMVLSIHIEPSNLFKQYFSLECLWFSRKTKVFKENHKNMQLYAFHVNVYAFCLSTLD